MANCVNSLNCPVRELVVFESYCHFNVGLQIKCYVSIQCGQSSGTKLKNCGQGFLDKHSLVIKLDMRHKNLSFFWPFPLLIPLIAFLSYSGSVEQADLLPEDDTEISYQHGSVWHPAHEMYPMCHHCPKNSTYEDCVHKRTLKRCDNGLFNICFTKSTKRDTIVHYNMGCANHKQCQRARAKPCKGTRLPL